MLAIVLLLCVAALAQEDPAPVACQGECGDATACLNSGRRLVSDVCPNEGDACCVAPTPCNVATPSGNFTGTCQGADFCVINGGSATASDDCVGGGGDVQCCTAPLPDLELARISSSSLTQCQVAALLRKQFDESLIAKLVCTAKHESTFTCNRKGALNRDGTRDYGLLQVNSRYWCSGAERSPAVGDCKMTCSEVLECDNNIKCAKIVYGRQGLNAWYGYKNFKRECDSYVLPAECRSPTSGGASEPVVTSPSAARPCKFQQSQGVCMETSVCGSKGGAAKASRLGATGCEQEPNDVMCCIIASSVPAITTPCEIAGNEGLCLKTCPAGRTAFSEADGAEGCSDPATRCCAPPLRVNAPVPIVSPPSGRSCALARPAGCSGLSGRRLTVNYKMADEIMRINAHARNVGVRVMITDSFRPSSTSVGASRSRHKVGMAIDMNVNGCNAACLCNGGLSNRGAARFISAVKADSTLWWGSDPRRPIYWSVGGCRTDSVHIQTINYDIGNYDREASCLNQEHNAGRFMTFECSGGASLLNDDANLAPELATEGDPEDYSSELDDGDEEDEDESLSAGEIAGIVLGAIAVLVLIVIAVFVVRNSRVSAGHQPKQLVETTAVEAGSVGDTDGGSYSCKHCGKAYDNADDLSVHVQQRHA